MAGMDHKDLGLHFTWITNTAIVPGYDVTTVMVTGFQQTVTGFDVLPF